MDQLSRIKEAVFAEVEMADPFKASEGKLYGGGSRKLHCRYWRPLGKPRALVMLIHGLGEHLEWYDELGRRFAAEGVLAFGHDHAGHGLSEGDRLYVETVDEYITDVVLHNEEVKVLYPDLPRFAVGHSMGGLIVLHAVLREPKEFRGMVLMAPLIDKKHYAMHPVVRTCIMIVNYFSPQFAAGRQDLVEITRDAEMVKRMKEDRLRWWGGLKAGTFVAGYLSMMELQKKLDKVMVPFLILHGEKDSMCALEGAKALYKVAPVEDKTLKVFEGAHHQLYIEPLDIRNPAMNETVSWALQRIPS